MNKGFDMSMEFQQLCRLEAKLEEFDNQYNEDYSLQDLHMEYIMENCHGDRIIGNGDMLIEALEDGYLYEDFRDYWMEKQLEVA
jgi:hypothetical protein